MTMHEHRSWMVIARYYMILPVFDCICMFGTLDRRLFHADLGSLVEIRGRGLLVVEGNDISDDVLSLWDPTSKLEVFGKR